MCGSSGTNTTTTNSSPPASVLNAYSNLTNAAGQIASQPLQQYSGSLVAGFTPQQQQGFQTVQNAQGMAQPYINSGAQMIGAAGQPVSAPGQMTSDQISSLYGQGTSALSGAVSAANTSPSAVSQYMSPYLQSAVAGTEAEQNEQDAQQQASLKGSAISSGAWGGDRSAVAQGILGGQQALANDATISGMENTGYQSAMTQLQQQEALQAQTGLAAGSQYLGLGNTQQSTGLGAEEASGWLGENAGSQMAGLGTTSLTDALTGASANLSAGSQQQQLAQEQLDIPYEEFEQQQAQPYQQLGWLGNLVEGTGSQSGGTSSTTSPSASTASQVGGLGLGFGSLLSGIGSLKTGGRAGYDTGGAIPDGSSVAVNIGGGAGAIQNELSGFGLTGAMPNGAEHSNQALQYPGEAIGAAIGSIWGMPGLGMTAGKNAGLTVGDALGGNVNGLGWDVSSNLPPGMQATGVGGIAKAVSGMPLHQWFGIKRGGNVSGRHAFASGGVPDVSISFIPTAGGSSSHGGGPPKPPNAAPTADPMTQMKGLGQGVSSLSGGLKGIMGGSFGGAGPQNSWSLFGVPNAGSGASTLSDAANADQAGLLGAADTGAMDTSSIGDASDLLDVMDAFKKGGVTKLQTGGPPQYVGANPNVQGTYDRYQSLPTEKLQEMAAMMPPNSPQGAMVQKALQQKQMLGMGSTPTSMAPQSNITPQGMGAAPNAAGAGMKRGGHFAAGGSGGKSGASATAAGSTSSPTPSTTVAATPAQTSLIDNDYEQYLGRMPEAGGVQFYANALNSGYTPSQLSEFFTSSPEYQSKFGNANISTSVTPQGNVVPQVQQSMFAAPTAAQASPGGGLGNWFNPLPQYQPPGTSTAGGGVSFPSYAIPSKISLSDITGNPSVVTPTTLGMAANGTSLRRGGRPGYDDAGSVDDSPDPTDDPVKNQAIIGDNEAAPVIGGGMGSGIGAPVASSPTAMAPQGNITPQGKGFDYQPAKPDPWTALATAGFAMAAGRSPHAMQNIAGGALAGMDEYQKELSLDDKPTVDTSTGTVRIYYPSEKKWIDTQLPTEQAQQRQQSATQFAANMDISKGNLAARQQELEQQAARDKATQQYNNGMLGVQQLNAKTNAANANATSYSGQAVKDADGNPLGTNMVGDDGTVKFVPIDKSAMPVAKPGPDMTKTGDDFLSTLSANDANQVKALADGRMAFPSGIALTKPYWQEKLQEVGQYDPSFDAVNYNTRAATRKWITSGKGADTATALNTAMGHASVLSDDFDKLNNFGGAATALNAPINWIEKQAGDPRQTNTQEALQALGSEARRVFAASGGGNLTELEQWEKSFPVNGSPEQQKGALQQLVGLFDSRINALGEQYSKGMGKTTDGLSLLSPEAQQSYAKLTGRAPSQQSYDQTGKPTGNPAPAPQVPPAPADASQRAAGQIYQTPKGPMTWTGTGWMPAK